ncbi:FadR/GntR family transcriptional regulator [Mycoplana dimorpha]|uniref:GntR family transcriptional regulator n=1 Tax=Mycoplana dimorpha TaxID=28320 RepID=A0A2T5B5Q2_MYCDI|nr:FadR/GntR family transcriptional regulator [Mycoplana dimorpha]PTM94318.1 GntR family transcriptional regulator [Mycoplana dimorpha]
MTEVAIAAAEVAQPRRPRVQKSVIAAIGLDICSERYPAGTALPRENDLCGLYGVSRTVIRETLKVLAAKGLVSSRPRVGTVVCAEADWNILDPQVLEWMGPRIEDLDLLGCILETRRTVEPVAAEFAAERATVQEIADLEGAWMRMRDADADGDTEAFTRADVQFHEILLKASHNLVFRQLSAIIHAALIYSLHRSNEVVDRRDEALEVHRQLVEALRLRDRAAARACSHRMLDLAARDLATRDAAPAIRLRAELAETG